MVSNRVASASDAVRAVDAEVATGSARGLDSDSNVHLASVAHDSNALQRSQSSRTQRFLDKVLSRKKKAERRPSGWFKGLERGVAHEDDLQHMTMLENEDAEDYETEGLLDPGDKTRQILDVVMVVLLLYVAILTPFELSMVTFVKLDVDEPNSIWWRAVNYVVDAFFVLDLVLTFFTVYEDPHTGHFVRNRSKIAKHYLKGWLFLDLISVIPFDRLSELGNSGGRGGSLGRATKVVRVFRLSKLTKLLRIFRMGKIMARVEARLGLRFGVINMIKQVCIVFLFAHWGACIWHTLPYFENPLQCTDPAEEDCKVTWFESANLNYDSATSARYAASLYWAVMTLTTIGYGDIIAVGMAERTVSILFQIMSACLFSMVVANVTALLSTLNRSQREYQEEMDRLNGYMKAQRLPAALQARLRDYFSFRVTQTAVFNRPVLLALSPSLRGEVVAWGYRSTLGKIPFLQNVDLDFVIGIALHFQPEVFAPTNFIYREKEMSMQLYVIKEGAIALFRTNTMMGAKIVKRGEAFGDDVLYSRYRRQSAQSMTYLCVLAVSKSKLESALADRPEVAAQIRTAATKLLWKQALKTDKFKSLLRENTSRHPAPSVTPSSSAEIRLPPVANEVAPPAANEVAPPAASEVAELAERVKATDEAVKTAEINGSEPALKPPPDQVDDRLPDDTDDTPRMDLAATQDTPRMDLAATQHTPRMDLAATQHGAIEIDVSVDSLVKATRRDLDRTMLRSMSSTPLDDTALAAIADTAAEQAPHDLELSLALDNGSDTAEYSRIVERRDGHATAKVLEQGSALRRDVSEQSSSATPISTGNPLNTTSSSALAEDELNGLVFEMQKRKGVPEVMAQLESKLRVSTAAVNSIRTRLSHAQVRQRAEHEALEAMHTSVTTMVEQLREAHESLTKSSADIFVALKFAEDIKGKRKMQAGY